MRTAERTLTYPSIGSHHAFSVMKLYMSFLLRPEPNPWLPPPCFATGSSQSLDILKKMAKENSIHLIGGSIPEREGEKLFNTSVICGPDGNVIAKHRKVTHEW